MGTGLLGGYGLFAWIGSRFMLPAVAGNQHRVFVSQVSAIPPGGTLVFETPDGRPVNITRRGTSGTEGDFVALSSTCPHLGCQVRWEAQNNRYFCPCHNGTFDPSGRATGGPPGDAGLSLPRYGLAVELGLLYILVPDDQLSIRRAASASPAGATAPCRGCGRARTDGTAEPHA